MVPFRPDERRTLILSVSGLEIGAIVEQGARHLQVAMPGGHMQWREWADDLLVEMLSRNVRIGAVAEQQSGRFRQTLLDGEVQQPPIRAGGPDQGRVGL